MADTTHGQGFGAVSDTRNGRGLAGGGGGGRPRKRSGDRGAHHKGVCVPTSV
ncbi:MAG: hypothetical protein LBK25_06990 [Treponema sp.]|nr:hypothetical protein [Treponema sp.]